MFVYIWGFFEFDGALGFGDERYRYYKPRTLLTTNTGGKKLEWVQIDCGFDYIVGLTKDGQVFTWGANGDGQLGHGDREERSVPTKVEALDELVIIKISCGGRHAAAITDEGELHTWGCGECRQLGHGNEEWHLTPKKVEALADEVLVDVACGDYHTCTVTSTGSIHTWGCGDTTGHVEDEVLLPRVLEDLSSKGVVSVSANSYHTACVTKDGDLITWGTNVTWGTNERYGKLGHGDEIHRQIRPKRVEALVGVKVTMVSCGVYHTAICTEDGHVYTFGKGDVGQLGHGDRKNTFSPVLVQALVGKHITQVQCGDQYTMALTSSGYVFTWGNAKDGRLGHGNVRVECFSFPCLVEGLREHNVVQISSYDMYCAALVDPTNPSSVRQSQQASFNNQELSDVVLMVENEPLYANIDVLTQKSDYFAAMFRSNMRESIERVVNVPNCSKAAFLLVLEYLCLDDFTVSIDDVVELWDLADFYQMEGLKYSCMGALERGLSEENVSQILQKVEDLSCPCDEVKRMCHEYLESKYIVEG